MSSVTSVLANLCGRFEGRAQFRMLLCGFYSLRRRALEAYFHRMISVGNSNFAPRSRSGSNSMPNSLCHSVQLQSPKAAIHAQRRFVIAAHRTYAQCARKRSRSAPRTGCPQYTAQNANAPARQTPSTRRHKVSSTTHNVTTKLDPTRKHR